MTAAVALLLTVGCSAPVPKAKEAALYFPLQEGTVLVTEMKEDGQVTEFTDTVTKVDAKKEGYQVTIDRKNGGRSSSTLYEVSAKGISKLTYSQKPASEPVPLLKVGGKAGDKWESEQKVPGALSAVKLSYVLGGEEDVEVEAGKFKAVRVDCTTEVGGRSYETTTWYAVGVGPVKTVITDGGKVSRTQTLKSYSVGK